jgi:hypothetical protein
MDDEKTNKAQFILTSSSEHQVRNVKVQVFSPENAIRLAPLAMLPVSFQRLTCSKKRRDTEHPAQMQMPFECDAISNSATCTQTIGANITRQI